MASNKLTFKMVEDAKPKEDGKPAQFADGEGLFLQVRFERGRIFKYWRFTYYFEGARKLRGFGAYPAISLAEARQMRREARDLLAKGVDPIQKDRDVRVVRKKEKEIKAAENQQTLRQIAQRMIEAKKGRVTDETWKRIERQLDIHVLKKIGDKDITDITSKELLAIFREVANETGHNRKKTYLARKLCQWVGEIYKYANFENPEFNLNPCASMIRHLPAHEEKHMRRIAREHLGEFLIALKHYKGYKETRGAIWMMLFTGVRQISIRSARWGDFDLDKMIWHRQPEKQDKERLDLPLPRQAIAILKCLKRGKVFEPEDLVFPSPMKRDEPLSEAAVCKAIKCMKFDQHMVGHGLRGLVTTELNELYFPSRMVETQVGHKLENKVEAAYNKAKLFEQRRVMMQFFADYLIELRNGKTLQGAKKNALLKRPEAKELMTGGASL